MVSGWKHISATLLHSIPRFSSTLLHSLFSSILLHPSLYTPAHRRSEASDVQVLLEVVRQMMVQSALEGGPLAGAMIWSAAHNDSDDQDG